MAENRDERVRKRAYEIWEKEGRPHGRHDEHWRRAAEEDLAREDAAAAKEGRGEKPPSSQPKPAGKSDPQKPTAQQRAGEKTKASSGRAAGSATGENGPGNAPGGAARRAKPRKADAAVKDANERAAPTPRSR
jgi:hypothetical protein